MLESTLLYQPVRNRSLYFCFIGFVNRILFGKTWVSHIPLYPDEQDMFLIQLINLKYIDLEVILLTLKKRFAIR